MTNSFLGETNKQALKNHFSEKIMISSLPRFLSLDLIAEPFFQ